MPWLQLHLRTQRDRVEAAEHAFEQLGALSISFTDTQDTPIFEPDLGETPMWADTTVTALFDDGVKPSELITPICQQLGVPESSLDIERLEDQDWERCWMENYHPIECAENLWVCPSWKPVPKPEATNIILDPGLAFGTGTHPTTYLCLQWLAGQDLANKQFVDFGCGSGILAIGALLLGANSGLGIDIDPQALEASYANMQRNGLDTELFELFLPEQAPKRQVQLVLANILAGPLVELCDTITEYLAPGAWLCLSGILSEQEPAIRKAYERKLNIEHIAEREGWICICGRRKD
jgi:ribosomal protein L11 methyltransferase